MADHDYPSGTNVYLFCSNTATPSYCTSAQVKQFKIYDASSILVRNFIPVKRISDNEIGMYDTVTDMFFENVGTGEFVAGPEVNNL